jgi:hypothetical protein
MVLARTAWMLLSKRPGFFTLFSIDSLRTARMLRIVSLCFSNMQVLDYIGLASNIEGTLNIPTILPSSEICQYRR